MKKSKSFYISLFFSLLILIFPVIFFIYHKTNGHMIDLRNFISYVSLLAFVLSMLFVLIKKIPGKIKIIITLVILCATSIFCIYVSLLGGFIVFESFNGIEEIKGYNETIDSSGRRYEDVYKLEKIELNSYGDFEDISHYYYFSATFFQQVGYTTIVKYDDESFEKETKRIRAENTFYSQEDIMFSYEGFDFILLKEDDENNLLPEEINYIGINDDTNEITYVCSLFALEDPSDDDILEIDCGWRYIIEEREKSKGENPK